MLKVGDKVYCRDFSTHFSDRGIDLKNDTIYTVERIFAFDDVKMVDVVIGRLKYSGYHESRFITLKEIRKQKINKFLNKLKQEKIMEQLESFTKEAHESLKGFLQACKTEGHQTGEAAHI